MVTLTDQIAEKATKAGIKHKIVKNTIKSGRIKVYATKKQIDDFMDSFNTKKE